MPISRFGRVRNWWWSTPEPPGWAIASSGQLFDRTVDFYFLAPQDSGFLKNISDIPPRRTVDFFMPNSGKKPTVWILKPPLELVYIKMIFFVTTE